MPQIAKIYNKFDKTSLQAATGAPANRIFKFQGRDVDDRHKPSRAYNLDNLLYIESRTIASSADPTNTGSGFKFVFQNPGGSGHDIIELEATGGTGTEETLTALLTNIHTTLSLTTALKLSSGDLVKLDNAPLIDSGVTVAVNTALVTTMDYNGTNTIVKIRSANSIDPIVLEFDGDVTADLD